ncbi:MAG: hypothetical protein M3Y87_26720 [Myxococcota bacterium]|nr:hypothetical protein [Myxococcota bacterium]
MRVRLVAIVSLLGLAACGGGSGTESGSGEGSSGQESEAELEGFDMEGFESDEPTVDHGTGSARELLGIQGPEQPWESMSEADQEMYMVAYVLPIHAELFREHDAEEYSTFECTSCHGDDAEERDYEMPSRYLPSLPAEGTPAWEAARARKPEAWAFMTDQVLPTMRTQLGEPEMTCYACHARIGG